MAEVNKVEIGFGANVRDFNRGVDKMERKLAEFEAVADKQTANVNKRFDLMNGSLGKVEKRMGGFGDNLDLTSLQDKLNVAQKEFQETGKVSEDSFRKLETSINRVDFSKLDDKATKSVNLISKDFGKLRGQLDKINSIRFAEEMPDDIKRVSYQFANLQKSINSNNLSLRQMRQNMSAKDFDNYKNAINRVRGSMSAFEKELRDTGTVSNKTFYDLNNRIKEVDFSRLPKQSASAFGSVRKHATLLRSEFNNMGTSVTRVQNRFNTFKNVMNKATGSIKNRWTDALNTFNRWGTVFRNMQEVGQHLFGGVLIPLISAMIPVAATSTTAIMGIADGLTSVGGAAVGLGGAYAIALGAVKAFSGQAQYALQMLEDGQLKVTAEVSRYQRALDALKGAWEDLIAQNQKAIFNTMSNGIDAARSALGQLNPFLTRTATLIEQSSAKMLHWVKTSNNAKGVFNMLNTDGVTSFRHVLNAGYLFGDGLAAIIKQLGPLITYMSRGLQNMAQKFNTFANSKKAQQGIADFTNYTKQNLPIAGSIFSHTFKGIFNLFRAFSGQTTWAMKGLDGLTAKFENWSANLSKTQGFKDFLKFSRENAPLVGKFIGNLVTVLVEFIKAAAPISVIVLKFTTAFLGWAGAMMKAHPWIGKVIASLIIFSGVIKSAMFISALVGSMFRFRRALMLLSATEVGVTLKTKLMTAATRTWGVVSKIAALATRGLGLAIRFMTGPVGIVITAIGLLVAGIIHLWKTNATFRNAVINIWNSIKHAAVATFGAIGSFLKTVWNGIATAWKANWNFIKNAAVVSWNAIKNAVLHPVRTAKALATLEWRLLKNASVAIWNGIKNVSIAIWNGIKNAVVGAARRIYSGVRAAIAGLRAFFVNSWNFIRNVSVKLWNGIRNAVVSSARRLVSGVKNVVGALRGWFVKTWTYIKTRTVSLANAIWHGVRSAFVKMSNAVHSVIGKLRGWIVKAWSFIKSKVVGFARSIWHGVVSAFSHMYKSVRTVVTRLRGWLTKAWSYIKSKVVGYARALWHSVVSAFSHLYKSVRSINSKLRGFLTKAWSYIKSKVVSFARSLWRGVVNIFNKLSRNLRSITTNLRKFLYRAWQLIKNKVSSLAKALWGSVKRTFTSLKNGVSSLTSKARNSIISHWKKIKSGVIGLASGLWRKVKSIFSTMTGGIKHFTGRIKSAISGMVTGVKKGLNKLVDGVNWVGNKLGMGKNMIPHIKLSTGTANAKRYVSNGRINQDTMAVVGDKGRGNGTGGFRNEMITYPNGKQIITPGTDTMAYLPKGSTVHSGAQTQSMMNAGTLPQFSLGSLAGKALSAVSNTIGGGKSPKKAKAGDHNDVVTNAKNKLGSMWGGAKHAAAKVGGKVLGGANNAIQTGKGAIKLAGNAVKKVMGDVEDWIEHPGKLVNTVLDKFGFNFNFLKGAEMPFKLMKGATKSLKAAAKKKITGWLDEYGGSGDGSYIKYLNNITTPYSPNGPPPGYAFSWPHPGIDLPYIYEKIQSTLNGTAYNKEMPGGFGHYILVKSGALEAIYGHLSKRFIKNGQHVHTGQVLGVSGNSGASTGPHLHYEMHKNGKPINPVTWLKKHSGGASKAASAWRPEVIKALRANHLPTSGAYVNAWIRQIQSESSGNAGAHQGIHDINSGGNEAQGLVQVTPSTFRAFKLPGHGNIMNGLDNLMAGIHYAKSRYGGSMLGVIGHGHGYENGGIVNSKQLAWLAEGGFSESVISHDPANRVKSKAIYDRTGEMLGFNDDTEILARVEKLLQEHNYHARNIDENTRRQAEKSSVIHMNGRAVAKEIAEDTNTEIKRIEARKIKFRKGGGR
ncbi:peptidoglycan DD-metalloendopeptidase family protein [Staphylococcus capitis]|uniref:peptidoglycan DD-metalloendopeptidase family protein n=1 Tax=Staphylococcus capitis TaxID=29388 RepID=UPI001B7D6E75|nr:peptidoglycan DD-metalloendopeptidase family protein [Staphylococcus capitis]